MSCKCIFLMNKIPINHNALYTVYRLATGRLSAEVIGTNRLDQECVLGFEFAGVNKKKERVMGTILSGAMATQLIPNPYLTWKVPDHWTLREAATVPVVYMTVYVAFFMYNPIRKGKKILIHAGKKLFVIFYFNG